MLESGEYHSSVVHRLKEGIEDKEPAEFVVISLRE